MGLNIVNNFANKMYNLLFSNIRLEDSQRQIVIYMLKLIIKNSFMWVAVFVIGNILGIWWTTLVFMLSFMSIRFSFGGWHSKNEYVCFLISVCMSILAGSVPKIINFNVMILGVIYIFALFIAIKVGVVDNPTKRLSEEKKAKFKKRGLFILLIVFGVNVVVLEFGLIEISSSIMLGVLIGFTNLLFAK